MANKQVRCAVYTRKSSEEGLEQSFNSLDAQREACCAFIQSQKHEGWTVLRDHYDDGGFSGGTMERPALRQLLSDIQEHKNRYHRGLQSRSAHSFLDGLFENDRSLRCTRRELHLGDPAVQYNHVHGPPDTECAPVVCSI